MDFETFKAQESVYKPNMKKKDRIALYEDLVSRYEAVVAENEEQQSYILIRGVMHDFRYEGIWVWYFAKEQWTKQAYERNMRLPAFEKEVFDLEATLQEAKIAYELYGNALTPRMGIWYVSERLQDGVYLLLAGILGGVREGEPEDIRYFSHIGEGYSLDSKVVREQDYTKMRDLGGAYIKFRFPDPASEQRFRTLCVSLDDMKLSAQREGLEEGLTLMSILASGEDTLEGFNAKVNRRHQALSKLRGV